MFFFLNFRSLFVICNRTNLVFMSFINLFLRHFVAALVGGSGDRGGGGWSYSQQVDIHFVHLRNNTKKTGPGIKCLANAVGFTKLRKWCSKRDYFMSWTSCSNLWLFSGILLVALPFEVLWNVISLKLFIHVSLHLFICLLIIVALIQMLLDGDLQMDLTRIHLMVNSGMCFVKCSPVIFVNCAMTAILKENLARLWLPWINCLQMFDYNLQ